MSIDNEYIKYLEDFKSKKFHKSYSLKEYDLYSYSSSKGKVGISNILIDILLSDFKQIEFRLFFSIIKSLKQSYVFEEACVCYLKYSLYSDYCSDRVFGLAIKKYVKYSFLIPTPKSKYYIVNPLYVNKLYKTKIKK